MSILAEQVVQFRAAGVSAVESAVGRVRSSLGAIEGAVSGPLSGLRSAIGSVISPANILSGIGMGIGMNLAGGLTQGITSTISLASQVETLSTSFEVLLGSSGAAKRMMEEINQFAAATPFEQMDLANVAKQLLAYGTASQDIIPTMRQLGDIAALSGARLEDLAAIYGKVQAQGKLTGETLEGWQSRGIPITRELANIFGVAESQVRELVSSGKVGFAEVQQAIARLTGEGGQFAGGMEKLATTTGGLWSTVTGNMKTAAANIGAALIELFQVKPILSWAGAAIGRFAEWAGKATQYLTFVRENWGLAMQIMLERIRLFLFDAVSYVKAFGANFIIAVKWFAENWKNVFIDIHTYSRTTVLNLFDNLRGIWTAFWDWVRTGDWTFDWKPLDEGFRSTIREWPDFVSAEVSASRDKLNSLLGEWDEKRRAFASAAEAAAGGAGQPAGGAAGGPTATAGAAAAGGDGMRAGFVGFAALAREMQQKALEDLQRRAVEMAQKTADGMAKLASAADGGYIRVRLDEPVTAIYG